MSYITINNKRIAFTQGSTILEVAQKAEIHIPTLCHLPRANHNKVCRICSVQVKGQDNFLPACASFAEENMEITTHSPELLTLRKQILTDLLAEGRHDCFMRDLADCKSVYHAAAINMPMREQPCPADGRCELQKLVLEHQIRVKDIEPEENTYPLDNEYPMISRDFSRCIMCGRCASACDAIQVNMAIPFQFGSKKQKEHWWPLVDYQKCTHCGECLQVCPTGALSAKKAHGLLTKHDETTKIRTTCPYCGIGCQQELLLKDGRIVEINGVENAEPNKGSLCVKGRFGYDFIYSPERLTTPLIKQADNSFKEASWEEALELIATKFTEIIEKHGSDAVAGVSCSRSINEDSYNMQKLFRTVFKTNNIDNCART